MNIVLLRKALVIGLLAVTVGLHAQCGPNGCFVAPRPTPPLTASPTVRLPSQLIGALARIVHQEGSGTSLGSGALVATVGGRSYFITCAHLFEGPGTTTVRVGGANARARIIAIDQQNDLALLESTAVTATPAKTAETPSQGELTACGFGSQGDLRCIRGPIVGRATAVGASAPSLRIRGAVRSGDSGGPVFNAMGQVVAVIWGERGGETFAMGGGPLRRILARLPKPDAQRTPVARSPAAVVPATPDPWREQIEQRLNELGRREPPPAPSLPKDLARREDLESLSQSWEQRFDQISTPVQNGDAVSPATKGGASLLVPGATALLTALGVGGPIGVGMFLAKVWLKRKRRREATNSSNTAPTSLSESVTHSTVAIDTPPPPQQVVPETHYVSYQRDDFARAHQWASEQLVRKFPGSVEMLASLDSLIKQQLNGKEPS